MLIGAAIFIINTAMDSKVNQLKHDMCSTIISSMLKISFSFSLFMMWYFFG